MSSLPSIFTKMIYNDGSLFSSDDDCQFRPAPNKRNKKKQKARSGEEEEDSSLADSESERLEETEDLGKSENCKDGKK